MRRASGEQEEVKGRTAQQLPQDARLDCPHVYQLRRGLMTMCGDGDTVGIDFGSCRDNVTRRVAPSAAPKPSQRLKTKPLSALVHGLWPTDPASLPPGGAVFAGKPQPSWVLLSDAEGCEVKTAAWMPPPNLLVPRCLYIGVLCVRADGHDSAGGAGLSPMVLAPPVTLGASIVVGEPEVADVKGFAIGALASHGLVALSLVVAFAYLVVVLCVEHDVAASPGS